MEGRGGGEGQERGTIRGREWRDEGLEGGRRGTT